MSQEVIQKLYFMLNVRYKTCFGTAEEYKTENSLSAEP